MEAPWHLGLQPVLIWTKPEPNMLKTLPIIPSSTSQKIYPLFLFYSHIITYYSYFILFVLSFCVLTSSETWTWCIILL